MSVDKSKENGLVGLHSEWVGKSYFRIRSRRVASTLLVDVMEYAERPSKKRAATAARMAASQQTGSIKSTGSVIFELEQTKKSSRLDENGNSVSQRTRIRTTTFAFGA